jgi:hypothetical protein
MQLDRSGSTLKSFGRADTNAISASTSGEQRAHATALATRSCRPNAR